MWNVPCIGVWDDPTRCVGWWLTADGRGSNGFVGRILFAYPEAREVPAWNEAEPDAEVADYWQAFIHKLLFDTATGRRCRADTANVHPPEAKRLWSRHHAKLKARSTVSTGMVTKHAPDTERR